MNAKANGAKRTGRAAAVREYLGKQEKPKTIREILEAIEPNGDSNLMSATLSNMLRGGSVERIYSDSGPQQWKLADPGQPRKKIDRALPRVTQKKRLQEKRHSDKPKEAPLRKRTSEQKANFCAPLGTVKQVGPRNNTPRESVEDFVRRGGKVEVLPMGACSQPLAYDYSKHAQQREKGRNTQQRNRTTTSQIGEHG